MNSTNAKTIAVVLILVVLGYFLYQQFSGSETETTVVTDANGQLITTNTDPNLALVGADIEALLAQINSVQIDAEIFTDPAYQSLTDLSNEVPALPQGKKNPFAPFAGTAKPTPKR